MGSAFTGIWQLGHVMRVSIDLDAILKSRLNYTLVYL